MVSAHPTDSNTDSAPREPRRWAPFWIALGIIGLLVGIAALFYALAPERDADAIPALERVNLIPESSDHGLAMGGFVAPMGWYWIDAETREGLRAPDNSTEIVVELAPDVTDPHKWFENQSAVGASFSPIADTVTRQGYPMFSVTEDLGANQITERVLVCAHDQDTTCVSLRITRTDANEWQQQIEDLINSVELV